MSLKLNAEAAALRERSSLFSGSQREDRVNRCKTLINQIHVLAVVSVTVTIVVPEHRQPIEDQTDPIGRLD